MASLAALGAFACGGAVVSLGDDGVAEGAADATADANAGASPDANAGADAATDADEPTSDGTAPDGGARSLAGDAGPTPALPFAGCGTQTGSKLAPADADAAAADVVGVWLLCNNISPFGTSDEIGIELLDTGDWYKMYNQNGLLVRGDADGELGTFSVTGTVLGDGSFTLAFVVMGSSSLDFSTTLSTTPQKMRLDLTTYAFFVAPPVKTGPRAAIRPSAGSAARRSSFREHHGMSADSSGKNPFQQFVGTWKGEDTIATTQWSRGGPATTQIEGKMEVGGRGVSQRIRSRRGDGQVVEALAVMTHGPEPRTVAFFWFDSDGFVPASPGIGRWTEEGDILKVERQSSKVRTRHVFRFHSATAMTYTLDKSHNDGATWIRVMEGDYRRG